MSIRRVNIPVLLMVAVIFTACDNMANVFTDWPSAIPGKAPPFVITKPVFEITEYPNYFSFAGMVFNYLNTAEENVDRITVSFMLFDADTQANPFIGSNQFEITKLDLVLQNENKKIIISLDRFIHIAPTKPYLIDYFYISEVHFADGTTWQDKYGAYRVR